ncbi:MAG: hypothetical protein JWL70_1710 [Acidimicrobiia bacterium]|nr:hypothetical protein [Acidimicrobiia bacterium]
MVGLEKDRIVAALGSEFAALDQLLTGLRSDQWALPTPCPGWDVQANVAHIIGTESALAGHSVPEVDVDDRPHVRNDIGRFNERWVEALSTVTPGEMVERFRAIAQTRMATLRGTSDEQWAAPAATPAGPATFGRFMRIRVFDCWVHEQDIRDAIGQPGHEDGPVVEVVLDEMSAALGFVIGKQARLERGQSVTFILSGPTERTVHVDVQDRAVVVEALNAPATVTLQLPVGLFTRLCGGRVSPEGAMDAIRMDGDLSLGRRIVEHLAYMI